MGKNTYFVRFWTEKHLWLSFKAACEKNGTHMTVVLGKFMNGYIEAQSGFAERLKENERCLDCEKVLSDGNTNGAYDDGFHICSKTNPTVISADKAVV